MGRIFVLDQEGIDALLRSALVGRIACCAHDDDRPYLVPIPFGYDGESIYSISGPGRKLDIMRNQPSVAFEVDVAEAEDRWQSVVADGEFEELTHPKERLRAIEIVNPAAGIDAVSPDAIVYRIRLTRLSGRFEVPDAEASRYENAMARR
ncbi:MAG TPA: pyridoxamine 5'-phosphate oxidase family protein [Thermomicrobiales bacterium]|nr:pyridoxamine 5'-phosphate oxidase family protein [Thermomicrobiales bacterium]